MSGRLSVGQQTRKLPSKNLHLSSLSSGDPEMDNYKAPSVSLCPALSYCHPTPPTPSRNLSGLTLKLNGSLVAKLSAPSLPSVISKEVQGKIYGLFTLSCSLSVLSFSTGSSPSFVFSLLLPSASLDFLAAS